MPDDSQTHERPTWSLRFCKFTFLPVGLLTCALLYFAFTARSVASLTEKGCRTCGNPESSWVEYQGMSNSYSSRKVFYCSKHTPQFIGGNGSLGNPQWLVEIPFLISPIIALAAALIIFKAVDEPGLLAAITIGCLGSSGFLLLTVLKPHYQNPFMSLLLTTIAFFFVSYIPFTLWSRNRKSEA